MITKTCVICGTRMKNKSKKKTCSSECSKIYTAKVRYNYRKNYERLRQVLTIH